MEIHWPLFVDANIFQVGGFLLAAYSVVANDSLQTLGTYLSSNQGRTPKALQMLFICGVGSAVLLTGWFLHPDGAGLGDPAWGRLDAFPLPGQFTWVYLLPPLAVLALTQWGAPVSTSFLVLTAFVPGNSLKLLLNSLWLCAGLCPVDRALRHRHVGVGTTGSEQQPSGAKHPQGLVCPAVDLHWLALEPMVGAGHGQYLCVFAEAAHS